MVSRTRSLVPIGLRTSFTRMVPAITPSSSRAGSGGRRYFRTHASQTRDVLRTPELQERLNCSLNKIMRIGRAQPFGKYVADSGQFDHSSNATRCDNSGSFGSWFQADLAGAETAENLMRDRSVPHRHTTQPLLRSLHSLP